MFGIGAGELVMILIAGLVIFGPGKLPEVGRAIGKGLREFRKAQAMFRATLDEVSLENEKKSVTLEKSPVENVTADKAVTTDKAVTADKAVTLDKNISADKPAENVVVDKTVSVEKNVTADKAVTADKTVSTDKTVSVEKALPLDNPTENISREKLIDAANKVFEEKKTAVSVDDVIQMAKDTSLAKPEVDSAKNEISSADKVSTAESVAAAAENNSADKVSTADNVVTSYKNISTTENVVTTAENNSADKVCTAEENKLAEKKTALNVYDVIEMAKNNSFVKEKVYEKIFGGTGTVTYDADVSKCINIARGGTDGT